MVVVLGFEKDDNDVVLLEATVVSETGEVRQEVSVATVDDDRFSGSGQTR